MVKVLPEIDPSEVLLFRAIVQLVLTVPIMAMMKASPLGPPGLRLLVYLQGIIGCLTVTCIFIGEKLVDISFDMPPSDMVITIPTICVDRVQTASCRRRSHHNFLLPYLRHDIFTRHS